MIVAALRLQIARRKRYKTSMNLEVEPEKALAADYVPTKEDIEKLRIKLNYSVRMFKKVRRVNNNLK